MRWYEVSKMLAVFRRAKREPQAPVSIGKTPVAIQHTPGGQSGDHVRGTARFIGGGRRLATCSGAAWFHGQYIATVNLLGNAVHTYRFDPSRNVLTLLQTLLDMDGLDWPENVACSPDGRVLAITNSRGGAVHLYPIEAESHAIGRTPVARIRFPGDDNAHGVSFSRCSRFLAFTTVDNPGYVRVHRMVGDARGRVEAVPFQAMRNAFAPLKPKGVDFSPDGRFVAVCYAFNAGARPGKSGGMLAVYPFSAKAGLEPRPVSRCGVELGLHNPDDLIFLPDGEHLIVTNQEADTAVLFAMDPRTGGLRSTRSMLSNPRAQLSYPHGAAVSSDGRYLAIANYGDDKLTVYALTMDGNPLGRAYGGSQTPHARARSGNAAATEP